MRRLIFIALVLPFAGQFSVADETKVDTSTATVWKEEANWDGLIIYSRAREGSSLKEFKSVGMIEAPPSTVFAVLNDAEAYPNFMPYTLECRVLKRIGDCTIAYQRLQLPLVSD